MGHGGRPPIDDVEAFRLAERHAAGVSYRRLAAELGMGFGWVQRRVERGRQLAAAGFVPPPAVAWAPGVGVVLGDLTTAEVTGARCRGCGEAVRGRRHVEDGSALCPRV